MKRLLPLVFLLSACGKSEPSAPPSANAAGRAYFVQAGCASCHKVGELGAATGPDLSMAGYRHTAEWLDLFIKDPTAWKKDTLMPNKRIPDEARAAIVAWLAEQKGQAWPAGARPWDAAADPIAKGRLIYARAGCASCHGQGGKGGYPNSNVKGGLIPALDKASETYTKAELVEKIRRGVPEPERADPKGPKPHIAMPSWGKLLSDAELDAVASYLLTLKPADGEKLDW